MADAAGTVPLEGPGLEVLVVLALFDISFCALGFWETISRRALGLRRILTTRLVRDFLTISHFGVLLVTLSRNDRDDRGRVASSAWFVVSSLGSSFVFLRRLRNDITLSSASTEDVFRFLRTRDPSIWSSSITNWLNTEWELGFGAPFWTGSRSLASLGADDLRVVARDSESSIPSTPASFSVERRSDSSFAQSGHFQLSGSWPSQL